MIHSKDKNGLEFIFKYDENGNKIYSTDNHSETWYKYDSAGHEILYKNNFGYERKSEYDDKGNLIHIICNESSGTSESWYEYDDAGNQIHSKNSDGYEVWYEYDSNNLLTYSKSSEGYETWTKYKSEDKPLYRKMSRMEEFFEYDSNDRLICHKTIIKDSPLYSLFEYEYYADGKVKIRREYWGD